MCCIQLLNVQTRKIMCISIEWFIKSEFVANGKFHVISLSHDLNLHNLSGKVSGHPSFFILVSVVYKNLEKLAIVSIATKKIVSSPCEVYTKVKLKIITSSR